mmetsp:Transcript_44520/g.118143  ORF Transcript_44520/g.118143 Transcript_44520/m.118143 type:complete len:464 (-) Transcript_44520:40-1431(-)
MPLLARTCLVLAGAVCAGALGLHDEVGPEKVPMMVDGDEARSLSFEVEQLEGGGMLIGRGNAPAAGREAQQASLLMQLMVPVAALGAGGFVYVAMPQFRTVGQLLLFFGAQAFMNLYMKSILSNQVVSTELHMQGFQAPLALTGVQQLVGFLALLAMVGVSQLTPWAYKPRRLESQEQVVAVLALSVCFTLNIALNNFSLSLVDMSVNVMIRSASPMTSLLLQAIFWRWFRDDSIDVRPVKVLLMLLGVIFAVCVVIAKYNSVGVSATSTGSTLGLALCVASLVFSSMELIVVVILGRGFKLNPIDTLLYMALPVFVLLLLPSFFLKHPVAYPGHPPSTDWSVLMEVARLSPSTLVLAGLSGIWALGYNILLYNLVRDLSPYFASFAANFNKVAAIGLALLMGMETLPHGGWRVLMVVGVLGNMASFTVYSLWPSQPAPAMADVGKAKFGELRRCKQSDREDP